MFATEYTNGTVKGKLFKKSEGLVGVAEVEGRVRMKFENCNFTENSGTYGGLL